MFVSQKIVLTLYFFLQVGKGYMVCGCIEKKPKLDMVLRLAWKCLLFNSSTLKGSGPLQRGNCCISRLKKEFNE